MITFFTLSILLAVAFVAYTPWRYRSDAQLIVKIEFQEITGGASLAPPDQTRQNSSEMVRRILNTHVAIFRSRDVIAGALNKVGLEKAYPETVASPPRFFGTPFEAALERMAADFAVTVEPNSNSVHISVLNRNPEIAQQSLRALIDMFVRKDAEVMRASHVNFLSNQVKKTLEQIADLQSAMASYKRVAGISSLEDERVILLKQRDLLEQNLAAENTQSLQLALATAQNQVTQSEQDYLRAQQRFAPGSELLRRSQEAATLARQQYATLLKLMGNGANPSSSDTLSLFATWKNQAAAINRRLDQLGQSEGRLLDWQRQLEVASKSYLALSQQLRDAQLSEAHDQQVTGSIITSQEPTLPYRPFEPHIVLVLCLGVLFGLTGGMALVLYAEWLDETVGKPDEVGQALGLPVLATLEYSRCIRAVAHDRRYVPRRAVSR